MTGGTPHRRGSRWVRIALGTLLLATAGACTTTVEGAAVASPAATAGPETDPELAIVPPPPVGPGRYLEARRLATATALIQNSFPERAPTCFPQDEIVDARTMEGAYFTPGTAAPVLERYGFVTAWGECASDGAGMGTIALSIELSDPASAAAAARELAAAAQDTTHRVSTVLDGATALVSSAGDVDTAQIWAPVGRTVAYVSHEAPVGQGLDGAVRVATEHTRLLAAFTPTPQADVARLPSDPQGLARFTADLPGPPFPSDGSYDLESYLRVSSHPLLERELLAANGFVGAYAKRASDGVLTYDVALYAFPTSAQTNTVYRAFAEQQVTVYGGTPFVLPSVPDAPCIVADTGIPGQPSFTQLCYVGYGGHMAGVAISGLSAPDDVAEMDRLLPAQLDLIDG